MPVPSQERERPCIYLLEASFLPLSTIFLIVFWSCSDSLVFFKIYLYWDLLDYDRLSLQPYFSNNMAVSLVDG